MPVRPKPRRRPRPAGPSPPALRRRRVREKFDLEVGREWARYSGEAWRVLVRELRDRFLARHLPEGAGWVLELGPGPGRFTPTVLACGARVVAVDLSLPMLLALPRRKPVRVGSGRLHRVRGAGEHLPFRRGTFRAAVVYGNILGFSAGDGPRLLAELARVVRPGGVLVLDVSSPIAATTEFLSAGARRRFLLRILRDPDRYLLSWITRSKDRSHQPYAPGRMAFWEFDFYTVPGAEEALAAAGFRSVDRMAVGAIGAFRDRLTTIVRRDRAAWRNLLTLEESVGRRPGVLETGHGFVMAAVRRGRAPRTRSKA
ncbi:MAG: class I SAM-dependent methyltransferase [Thermoplasmata archaeon]